MKQYMKPAMMVLSLSANDSLCACTYHTRNQTDTWFQDMLTALPWIDADGDNLVEPEDGVLLTENCGVNYEDYCKMTAESQTLFTS